MPSTKRPSNKKLRAKIKPHLAPLFAKIIINRFRLINKQKRLGGEVVNEVLIRSIGQVSPALELAQFIVKYC